MRIKYGCKTLHLIGLLCIVAVMPAISLAGDENGDAEYWIDRLQSPKYADRSDAMLKLHHLGRSAIEALEAITRQTDADHSGRAFDILKSHFDGDDATLKDAANSALHRIANDPGHRKSHAAKKALNPKPKAVTDPFGARMVFPGINQAMRIQLNGRIQLKGGGGKKELSINENGKKFRFVEDENGIQVERPDGKGGMKKGSYRDSQELKKKDPDAHRMYDKFFGGKNGMRIQIGGAVKPVKPVESK